MPDPRPNPKTCSLCRSGEGETSLTSYRVRRETLHLCPRCLALLRATARGGGQVAIAKALGCIVGLVVAAAITVVFVAGVAQLLTLSRSLVQ